MKAIDVTITDGGLGDYSRGDNRNNSCGGHGFSDRRNNGYGYRSRRGGGECFNCGEFGHMARDCDRNNGGGCYTFGLLGSLVSDTQIPYAMMKNCGPIIFIDYKPWIE